MKAHYLGTYNGSPDEIIDRLLHPPTSIIAVDVETVSLKDRTMLGFGVAINPKESYYIPVWPERSEILEEVYSTLVCSTNFTKLGHNYNFDLGVFRQFAVANNLLYPDVFNIHDTGIMANVSALDPDLHHLSYKYSGTGLPLFTIQDLLEQARANTGKRNVTMLDVDPELIATKCMNDVRTTYAMFEPLMNQLTPQTMDCYQVDRELVGVLKTTEQTGLGVNQDRVKQRKIELDDQIEMYEDWADDNGFSISSPAQVGMFLANMNVVLPTTKSGRQLDTSEETLRKFQHIPAVKSVLEYRKLAKLKSTYVDPFEFASRAFTHFRLDLATGRLASASEECTDHVCRNQQNVPPDLRDIFESDSGCFTWADMSQLEMRVFAYLSKDSTLLELYKTGESIHNDTFKIFYPDKPRYQEDGQDSPYYRKAKTGNFAMIFDAQEGTISAQCEIPIPEAKRFKITWFGRHPEAKQYMDYQQSKEDPYEETIFGRRMLIPQDYGRGKGHAKKTRINYPVQGSGADLNKRALLKMWKSGYLNKDNFRLQVHDEVVMDGRYKDEFPHELVTRIHPEIEVPWEVKEGPVWV